jgi:hypothetical protein
MYLIGIFDVNKLERIAGSKGTGCFERRELRQLTDDAGCWLSAAATWPASY